LTRKFDFADLFAGIGGFHIAAHSVGGRCVFASEINPQARETYKDNLSHNNEDLFNSGNFFGDVKDVNEVDLPNFDFLFAGFPCQPFSKGGHRRGFEDTRGTLFFDVARIIKHKKPPFVLLENVRNLVTHDEGNTFKTICNTLDELGYALNTTPLILSPDDFGIPAIRKRIFIPAIRKELIDGPAFQLDFSQDYKNVSAQGVDEIAQPKTVDEKYHISDYEKRVIEAWNEFYLGIDLTVVGYPIWSDEFRETYDYQHLPEWKQNFIKKNRALYMRNKPFISKWLEKYEQLTWMQPTHRKMEWQAGADIPDIYGGLIQFRPSGVRIKRPNKFSTLVAMNHPQIIGKYLRRLTPDETKILQSFPESYRLHPQDNIALKQLGNSINIDVATIIIKRMMALAACSIKSS
jgi:DNA (cytosine-5)-methyltransferase 1